MKTKRNKIINFFILNINIHNKLNYFKLVKKCLIAIINLI